MINKKPILKQVNDLQVLVNKLKMVSFSLPENFQVGEISTKFPPSWKYISKRIMHKSEGKVWGSLHNVLVRGSS